ncbi:hypothetical protein ACHQM5_023300 [Ranunculus cassubicifolius]
MGICSSCESTSVATAKLILPDGQLQEFPYPIKASYVLQKHPSYFICDSDSMEFDGCVSALHDSEELQAGHLYFALPLRKLRYSLPAEEMAALAVKASLALMKTKTQCCPKETKQKVSSDSTYSQKERLRLIGDGGSVGGGYGKKRRSTCKGTGRNSASTLTVIQE